MALVAAPFRPTISRQLGKKSGDHILAILTDLHLARSYSQIDFGPLRHRVDTMAFPKSEALHPADFTVREDGVVRLSPELARRVASLVLKKESVSMARAKLTFLESAAKVLEK